jgi:serine/threonine protein kinase
MATSPHIDRQTFLANLRQSGLVRAEQLAAVAGKLPDTSRGRELARALVGLNLLTRFQAEQLLAGRTSGFFLGQYRILEQLGQGGMGRVFKAEHRTMGRIVALKVLGPSAVKNERARELFQREMRAAALLVHPNIVTAFDANQVGDRFYLVMEYVNGPNLDQLVREQGPLPVGQACDFIRQVALGLHYAHQHGMVHRDIKPSNLMLQHRGSDATGTFTLVKISDFGLARCGDQGPLVEEPVGTILTKANTIMGTPDYLSPEQARNLHNADIRSDLYSLGCTFYFLLSGQVPYPGGSTMEKLIRHSAEEPTPITALCPGLPPPVGAIVQLLMAKDPDERFQTPAEVVEVLTPFAVSSPAAWSGVHSTIPLPERADTPEATPVQGVDPLGGLSLNDPSEAQTGTLPPETSPTPVSLSDLNGPQSIIGAASSVRLSVTLHEEQRQRFRLALYWTFGIIGGLAILIAALAIFAAGK